ncbi:MAG: hypothetical protein V4613_11930 [Bacteroidota bacterium]
MKLKQIILSEPVAVFFFCFAVIFGPAITVLFANDLSQFTDCNTYIGLAHFDFEQSAVRRYRVIIPFIASGLDYIGSGVFDKLAPTHFVGDFSLPFSFFLVNTTIMSLFGCMIYRYCRAFDTSRFAAVIGTLFMLSARYTAYFAALPFIDSLFCLIIAMTLVGLKEKNTKMLLFCLLLGPFAKESYIFIAPMIFFFGAFNKRRLLGWFALSGLLVFSYHFLYDYYYPPAVVGWFKAEIYHFYFLKKGLAMLFSFYGLYKIAINIGFWILLPVIAAYYSPALRLQLKKYCDARFFYFAGAIVLQMLLSLSMERMFYLMMPVLAVIMAMSFDELRKVFRFQ